MPRPLHPPAAFQGDTICVLGIGNVLWADEGFGVRCVEALQQRYEFAPHVELIDGGTQGLYLIQHVQRAARLLIFDAIDYGLPAGTLKLVEDDEVPRFMGAKKMSLHQTGFQEVLSAADLMDRYPRDIALIGCQPLDLEDWGGPLTTPVATSIEPAIAMAADILAGWGVAPILRAAPLPPESGLLGNDIDRAAYERPRADAN